MKSAVDEHIPLMTIRVLQDTGHAVRDIRGTVAEGMQDEALGEIVQREERLLITTDKGFTQYRTVSYYGILVVRLRTPNRHRIHHRIMQAMAQLQKQRGLGCWWSCAT
jgi:predicted nuclease of predicted toxin-antitoxin system